MSFAHCICMDNHYFYQNLCKLVWAHLVPTLGLLRIMACCLV